MTVTDSEFPLGYFYIVSKMNDLVIDLRGPETATLAAKIVMAAKKPVSPERDSQLWIHQNGFLTNKSTGLVLDINKAESFVAIFTKENRLYLDKMKEQEAANDQRFGYEAETGYIYALCNRDLVVDIRHEDTKEDARVMVYQKKPIEEAINQLWTIELGDPPRMIDSDDEDEDDSKRERMKAWFGNWKGWGRKKGEVMAEKDLEEANQKVYKDKKSKASYELIAAAAAYEAVNVWEKKQKEDGNEVHHSTAKKLIAGIAAKELVKLLAERGDEDIKNNKQKNDLITNMTKSAAINYFDSKHGH
ncbi:hypothetical protein EDC94DRAFT_607563 [Helicostylum pulchrum]|uniref:Uncharacterized protein n=1 Tax=Helicostylum pulchrum TaxID=562976 RepID=A0ABP9YG25_9FUNG|nr:hypothetical protein EDC94DRAFT_607563 [Helicostylum pulchrum]